MAEDTVFEFQVAFSFLKEDEVVAYSVNDLIQDRITTFIYSKNQEELVGSDGEEKFYEIFAKKSRVVVIFYRSAWGQTAWTRIEMTAIKNRSLEEGYGFSIFVPLDTSPMPIWLPKTIIWFNFARWGATGLAGVIESKLSELGSPVQKVETAIDYAARKKRALDLKKEIERYLLSIDAYKDADSEFRNITAEVNKVAESLLKMGLSTGTAGSSGKEMILKAGWYSLRFIWSVQRNNSLTDSVLAVGITKRANDWEDRTYSVINKTDYNFHMNELKTKGWLRMGSNEFYQSAGLVDKWAKELIKLIER